MQEDAALPRIEQEPPPRRLNENRQAVLRQKASAVYRIFRKDRDLPHFSFSPSFFLKIA